MRRLEREINCSLVSGLLSQTIASLESITIQLIFAYKRSFKKHNKKVKQKERPKKLMRKLYFTFKYCEYRVPEEWASNQRLINEL